MYRWTCAITSTRSDLIRHLVQERALRSVAFNTQSEEYLSLPLKRAKLSSLNAIDVYKIWPYLRIKSNTVWYPQLLVITF